MSRRESTSIVVLKTKSAFAAWITGLPASGKSTLAAAVRAQLEARGIDVVVLESDELRKVFTPEPKYTAQERNLFYRQMVYVGVLLTSHGVPVIFDATANRREYRNLARKQIPRFVEVYVDSPVATCMARDPKRIYESAVHGSATAVPGIQAEYEPPENPELIVKGDLDSPQSAAGRLIAMFVARGYLRND